MPSRRGFLGGAAAALSLLWLPKPWGLWFLDGDGDVEEVEELTTAPRRSALPDHLSGLSIMGLAHEFQAVYPTIERFDGTVLYRLAMNAFGGFLVVNLHPGEEIYGPVKLVMPGNVEVIATGVSNGIYVADRFRSGEPIQRVPVRGPMSGMVYRPDGTRALLHGRGS